MFNGSSKFNRSCSRGREREKRQCKIIFEICVQYFCVPVIICFPSRELLRDILPTSAVFAVCSATQYTATTTNKKAYWSCGLNKAMHNKLSKKRECCRSRDKRQDGPRGCFLFKRLDLGHDHASLQITITIITADTVLTSGQERIFSKCMQACNQ